MSSRGKPQECGLKMMPYISGFFLSIPAKDSEAVCNKLHEDNIFCVPLAAGVRVGLCCTPLSKNLRYGQENQESHGCRW